MYRVNPPTSVAARKQLPPSGSDIKNENYWNYTGIPGGHEPVQQRRQRLPDWITPPGGVEFGTEVETNDGDLPSYNLRVSLSSVLTCNTVDAFPAKFSLEELTL
ncbi:hypothetical protein PTI98_011627 [Pleurotus ostreatus]|nr:hypothetical protein PTI98_011627 [Pleurotus ostreatus]